MAANLFNGHKDVSSKPSTWFVACFLPSLGPESKWDGRGGNSKSVRSTELMLECNDCLWRKLAQQIEREKEEQPLAKETTASLARKNRPKSQKEKKETVALYAAATILAVSQGSKKASLADWHKCSGVHRL